MQRCGILANVKSLLNFVNPLHGIIFCWLLIDSSRNTKKEALHKISILYLGEVLLKKKLFRKRISPKLAVPQNCQTGAKLCQQMLCHLPVAEEGLNRVWDERRWPFALCQIILPTMWPSSYWYWYWYWCRNTLPLTEGIAVCVIRRWSLVSPG